MDFTTPKTPDAEGKLLSQKMGTAFNNKETKDTKEFHSPTVSGTECRRRQPHSRFPGTECRQSGSPLRTAVGQPPQQFLSSPSGAKEISPPHRRRFLIRDDSIETTDPAEAGR